MFRSLRVSTLFLFALASALPLTARAADWLTVSSPGRDNCVWNGARELKACLRALCPTRLPTKLHVDITGTDEGVAVADRVEIMKRVLVAFGPHVTLWQGATRLRAEKEGWPYTRGWQHAVGRALIARTELMPPDSATLAGRERFLVQFQPADPNPETLLSPTFRPLVWVAQRGENGKMALSPLGFRFVDGRVHLAEATVPVAFTEEQTRLKALGFTLRGTFRTAGVVPGIADSEFTLLADEVYEFWADGRGSSEIIGRAELHRRKPYRFSPGLAAFKLLTVGPTGNLGDGPLISARELGLTAK